MSEDDKNQSDETPSNVGYGKPPQQTRFKKGRSGNPRGRPKGSRSLKSHLMKELDAIVTVNENGVSKQISKREAAAKHIVNKAACGDPRMIKLVRDLIGDVEDREDEQVKAKQGLTARDRIAKKLDEMSVKVRERVEQLYREHHVEGAVPRAAGSTSTEGS